MLDDWAISLLSVPTLTIFKLDIGEQVQCYQKLLVALEGVSTRSAMCHGLPLPPASAVTLHPQPCTDESNLGHPFAITLKTLISNGLESHC